MTPPTPPLPPACADCVTVMKPAQPGAAPQQYATRIQRSGDGKMRMDSGASSVIVDPPAGKTILLDHVKKEAHIAPLQMPAPPGAPQVPGMPGFAPPGAPPPSPVQVQDLGKGFIEGHEVEGKRYVFHPPVPQVSPPAPPQAPGMPKPPAMPGPPPPPAAPPVPTVSEVWTSTKLKMPVLTKTSGSFGEQTCHCRCTEAVPHPAVFQIPPDYKTVMPAPPQPPK